jgi:pyrroline-5-carboxylate reductase
MNLSIVGGGNLGVAIAKGVREANACTQIYQSAGAMPHKIITPERDSGILTLPMTTMLNASDRPT